MRPTMVSPPSSAPALTYPAASKPHRWQRYDQGVSVDSGKEQLVEYVRLWAANVPLLEELGDQEIRQADTAVSLRMFELAFRKALRELPPRDSSGLVEWQDLLCRQRSDD